MSSKLVPMEWLIQPSALSQMLVDYSAKLGVFDVGEQKEQPDILEFRGDLAIIKINGPMTPKDDFFTWWYGGTSYASIIESVRKIEEAGSKNAILHMNTPGGTAEMAFETEKAISDLAAKINVTAYSDGMIASAGALLASAAHKTIISSGTVQSGSIGTIIKHDNITKLLKDAGVTEHVYKSGEFKDSGSRTRDPTPEDKKYFQEKTDYMQTLFTDVIHRNRGISVEEINGMEARIYVGQQGIDAGLVDRIATFDSLIQSHSGESQLITLEAKMPEETAEKDTAATLTSEGLKTANPALYSAIRHEGFLAGQERVLAIQSVSFPGQEDLVSSLITNTGLSAGDAALQLNKDLRAKNTLAAGTLETEAPEPVKVIQKVDEATPEDEKVPTTEAEFKASKLSEEFESFEIYQAFAQSEGKYKILGK